MHTRIIFHYFNIYMYNDVPLRMVDNRRREYADLNFYIKEQ